MIPFIITTIALMVGFNLLIVNAEFGIFYPFLFISSIIMSAMESYAVSFCVLFVFQLMHIPETPENLKTVIWIISGIIFTFCASYITLLVLKKIED